MAAYPANNFLVISERYSYQNAILYINSVIDWIFLIFDTTLPHYWQNFPAIHVWNVIQFGLLLRIFWKSNLRIQKQAKKKQKQMMEALLTHI